MCFGQAHKNKAPRVSNPSSPSHAVRMDDSLSCPKFDRENVAKTYLLSVMLLDVIKSGHLPLVSGDFT